MYTPPQDWTTDLSGKTDSIHLLADDGGASGAGLTVLTAEASFIIHVVAGENDAPVLDVPGATYVQYPDCESRDGRISKPTIDQV